MWVISVARLRDFWQLPGRADSQLPLKTWHKEVSHLDWHRWSDLKASYPAASIVGDCVVFNIGGNKYRLIARVRYRAHRVYVLRVLTHTDYGRLPWADECGCLRKPPRKFDRTGRQPRSK